MTRPRKWLAIISFFVVVTAVFIYLFNWNVLRGFVEHRVTHATRRSFHINGDMDIKLGWHPKIILNKVTFGNAPWSDTPLMAQVQHAEFSIALGSLFGHKVSIPFLSLKSPILLLEKNSTGSTNWTFDEQHDKASEKNGRTLVVRNIQIDNGQVVYRSVVDKTNLMVTITSDSGSGSETNPRMLRIKTKGTYLDLDMDAHGEVGTINSLEDLQRAYPIHLQGHIGKTQLQAQGIVTDPLQLQGLHLAFELSGGSLADLFLLVGVPLPPTPPYSLSGKLLHNDKLWDFPDFHGHIGNSDMHGRFVLKRASLPQFISADLQSDNLDLKDLSGLIGGREQSGKTIVNSKRVLPDTPFSFEKLHAANAEVHFNGKHVKTERLPIDDMTFSLTLKDGRLLLNPLNFGVADGSINATINLNSNSSPIDTAADITLRKIRIDQLFPGFKFEKANAGVIGGRAKLVGQGNSIAKMLGSANGQVAFMMYGGSISKLVVRLANLDVANSVAVLVNGDKSVPIRCMVTDLDAQDGNMVVKTMVLDNQKSLITGQGNINFKDETLNLRLTSNPKDTSLLALRGPIEVGGTFKHPTAGPELKNVSGRVAVAAVLGSLASPLAFIPLIEIGDSKDSNCAGLLKQAEAHSQQAVKAPVKIQPTDFSFTITDTHSRRVRF